MAGKWLEKSYEGKQFENILVVGVHPDLEIKKAFEQTLVKKIASNNHKAIACTDVLPPDEEISKETFYKYFDAKKIDGVIVTRLVEAKFKETYISGQTVAVPGADAYGFYGYYSRSYDYIEIPSHLEYDRIVKLNINVFETKDGKRIWAGSSESFNPPGAKAAIKQVSGEIVKNLKEDGVL